MKPVHTAHYICSLLLKPSQSRLSQCVQAENFILNSLRQERFHAHIFGSMLFCGMAKFDALLISYIMAHIDVISRSSFEISEYHSVVLQAIKWNNRITCLHCNKNTKYWLIINRIDCGQFLWCWSMRWEKQRATKIDRQNGTKHQLKLVEPNTLRNKCQCFASLAILLMADINKSNEIQWLRFRVPFERKTNSHNQTYEIDGESQCAFTISEQSMMYRFSRQWFCRFEKRNANATADCCFMAQFHTLFCHLQTLIFFLQFCPLSCQ